MQEGNAFEPKDANQVAQAGGFEQATYGDLDLWIHERDGIDRVIIVTSHAVTLSVSSDSEKKSWLASSLDEVREFVG